MGWFESRVSQSGLLTFNGGWCMITIPIWLFAALVLPPIVGFVLVSGVILVMAIISA